MRVILMNHCHPDRPHVCGLRVGRLGSLLAERGHKVVIICEAPASLFPINSPKDLSSTLQAHNWDVPYILALRSSGFYMASRAREGKLPIGIRHLVIAWTYLRHWGMFPDWQAVVRGNFAPLSQLFKPDVIWGTFGNTDTWSLCAELSAYATIPWVGDYKDNWLAFIPFGFRSLMARRFKLLRHMTVLSSAHCTQANLLFPRTIKSIMYSGVEYVTNIKTPSKHGVLNILLTGSIYNNTLLTRFCKALGRWADTSSTSKVMLIYAGNDGDSVKAAAKNARITLRVEGFMPQPDLHRLQAEVNVNVYLFNPICLLHHKALELIAAGRPLIAFGGETLEVQGLASRAGTLLYPCVNGAELHQALDLCEKPQLVDSPLETRKLQTWSSCADVLEDVLRNAISISRGFN